MARLLVSLVSVLHGNYWTDAIGCEIVNGPVATIQELLRHLTNPDKKEKKGKKKNGQPANGAGRKYKSHSAENECFCATISGADSSTEPEPFRS